MSIFKGSGVALVTPFKDGGVNYKKLEELIEWHIKNETDALIVCGTSGEAAAMSTEERKKVIKFSVEVASKRIPVIAGTGSNDTSYAASMSSWADKAGVDALLLVTPYYNKTTQRGLVAHYKAIAGNVNVPIILYNVPSRTGMNITPQTLQSLSRIKNIKAIKEASGDISQIAKMKALLKDDIDIYSGNDDQIVPILSIGGIGVISVIANILPKKVHDICMLYFNGEIEKSRNMFLDILPLMNALFIETNPIPIKTAMNLMGMDVGDLRLPLCSMSEENIEKLKIEMKKCNLI